jgi:hypothetical protein
MKKGMIAHIRDILFPTLYRRFDHWLLLRAPMLWRTRPVHLLVLLSLAVIAAIPLLSTKITGPLELDDLATDTVSCWWWRVVGSAFVIAVWVGSIIRKPVGELAPHRHIMTVVVVAIGSYLWLITPRLLADPQINAIKRFGSNNLAFDYEFLGRHRSWHCVPPDVWNNKRELEQLRNILAQYSTKVDDRTRGEIDRTCPLNGSAPLRDVQNITLTRRAIEIIAEARGDQSVAFSESQGGSPAQFMITGIDFSWFSWWWVPAAALGIGILTSILSYPRYVWRRTFGRG